MYVKLFKNFLPHAAIGRAHDVDTLHRLVDTLTAEVVNNMIFILLRGVCLNGADACQGTFSNHPFVEAYVTRQYQVNGMIVVRSTEAVACQFLPTVAGAADSGDVRTVLVVKAQGDTTSTLH